MARDITSDFKDAIIAGVVQPILAVELDFSTGTLYFWNGYGDLSMTVRGSPQTFTGLGDLGGVSAIGETTEMKASGITLTLTGVKSSLISEALSANYTNRNAYVYLGLFDASKNVIADVYVLFSGKMDVLKINEQAETSTIELAVENRLISFDRANERRYTHEDQQIDYAGDLGFEFIPDLQDKPIVWGKQTS